MISQQAIQKVLGIKDEVYLSAEAMSRKLNVTFYPFTTNPSQAVKGFSRKLEESLIRLGVNIIPFENASMSVPVSKRIKRFSKYFFNNILYICRKVAKKKETSFYIPFKFILSLSSGTRLKKGIAVICVGEQKTDLLPMQQISNFKDNSIITILDFPSDINETSTFLDHFNTSMSLFAYHMTNIILAVDSQKMMVYNFNASHPIYPLNDGDFDKYILKSLVPKIVAPISPHRFDEFKISNESFDVNDNIHRMVVDQMQQGAKLFNSTGLFPDWPSPRISDTNLV